MKKQLLAAAVAGAIAAPAAMAAEGPSVNLYWPIAVQIGSTDFTNSTTNVSGSTDDETVVDGGGARLMFNWSDQLNNGLTLSAYMSFGNLPASEASGINSRNSNIGLHGDFGSIHVGANEHFFETDTIIDGYGADWANGGAPLYFITLGRTGFNFTRRDTNSVWWNSKNMNGFQVKAAYIFGPDATAGNSADPKGYQFGVAYDLGGIKLGANMAQYDDYAADGSGGAGVDRVFVSSAADAATLGANAVAAPGQIAGSDASAQSWRAAYDFGSFQLAGTMFSMKQTLGASNLGVEATGYGINVTMPTSGGRIIFNMSELDDQDITEGGTTQALRDSGKSGFDISYQHDVSANTYMFIMYAAQDTGDNFDDNADNNTIANGGVATLRNSTNDSDSESSAIMLGITASF